jgi:hypothetical protein
MMKMFNFIRKKLTEINTDNIHTEDWKIGYKACLMEMERIVYSEIGSKE